MRLKDMNIQLVTKEKFRNAVETKNSKWEHKI